MASQVTLENAVIFKQHLLEQLDSKNQVGAFVPWAISLGFRLIKPENIVALVSYAQGLKSDSTGEESAVKEPTQNVLFAKFILDALSDFDG